MPRSEIRLTQITAWITIAALVTVVMLNNNLINVLIKFYNNIYTKKPLKNKWFYIRKGFSQGGRQREFILVMGVGCCWRGGPGPVKISWQRAQPDDAVRLSRWRQPAKQTTIIIITMAITITTRDAQQQLSQNLVLALRIRRVCCATEKWACC